MEPEFKVILMGIAALLLVVPALASIVESNGPEIPEDAFTASDTDTVPMVTTIPSDSEDVEISQIIVPGAAGSRFGQRRYVVGAVPKNPPTGISIGTSRGISSSRRSITAFGTSSTTGISPPSSRFVRWSPLTRWQSGSTTISAPSPAPIPVATVPVNAGTISGVVWNDLNGNRQRDTGDPGIGGWTITLKQYDHSSQSWVGVGQAITNLDGTYSFTGLGSGNYLVEEAATVGWTMTYPTDNAGGYNMIISDGQWSWINRDFGNSFAQSQTSPPTTTPTATYPTAAPVATTTVGAMATMPPELASATESVVLTMSDTWDADIENDGINVVIWLRDAEDNAVDFEGISLPVDIEIWTTTYDKDYEEQNDQLVYSGSGTIEKSFDRVMRLPFELLNVPPGETFGITYAKVHMPDGQIFESKDSVTSLVP